MRTTATTALGMLLVASVAVSSAAAQPSAVAPNVILTPREQALLARGEISGDRHVLGVVGAVIPGLGLGHLIQQRWKERGWIFTLGEFAAFGLVAAAAAESDLDPNVVGAMAIVGWGGLLGLRVWEVTDAVTGPKRHNRRVRELRTRAGIGGGAASVELFVTPLALGSRSGTIAGVALYF